MKILSEIPPVISEEFALEQYWSSVFPLSLKVIDYVTDLINSESTVVLYSGGPRLNYDAIYIEPAIFSTLPVAWNQKTLFLDPKNKILLNYTIRKLNPKNLLILNSNIFIRYRLWNEILLDIQNYKNMAEKVIVSMPVNRFDFNRLKFSIKDITKELNGQIIDNTIILCH
jgi:hypothetical protein